MSGDLLKVKVGVGAEGAHAEVVAGESLPVAIAKLFPGWALKVEMRRGITASIIKKLKDGQPIDRADADFAEGLLGENEATWLRRKEIADRAAKAISDAVPPALPPKSESDLASAGATAEEWVRRFWEDAGSVSDEVLQEIYARVLAAEATAPKSCTLRTLRALRYLDRETAERFALILPCALSLEDLPRGAYVLGDIPFGVLLDLQDAGLLDANDSLFREVGVPVHYLTWGQRIIRIECEGHGWRTAGKHGVAVYTLTTAGRELARIAHTEHPPEIWARLVPWLFGELPPNARISVTDAPAIGSSASLESLAWTTLERPTP
jgi:hypothetical protein